MENAGLLLLFAIFAITTILFVIIVISAKSSNEMDKIYDEYQKMNDEDNILFMQ